MNGRRGLAGWLLVALLLRFAYLAHQQATSPLFAQPLLDEEEMMLAAKALLDGKGFGPEPLFKAPLYPMLLAAVMAVTGDAWFFAMRGLQHLLGVAFVAILWDGAGRLVAPGRSRLVAAHVAAALVALNAPLIRLEHQLILDFLTVFLQGAMLWALLRWRGGGRACWRWAVAAGVLAALAWLNRPTITPVLPFLILWMAGTWWGRRPAVRHDRLRAAASFAVPVIVVMAMVVIRNQSVGGEAMLLPWQGGWNFHESNKPGANGRYLAQTQFAMSETGNPTRALMFQGLTPAERAAVGEGTQLRHGRLNGVWMDRAIKAIASDPGAWAALMARKLLWLGTDREIYNIEVFDVQRRLSPILRHLPVTWGLVWPLALAGLPLVVRRRRPLSGLLWMYLLLYGGAVALYYVSGRLRAPLYPAAIMLAGACVGSITGRLGAHSRGKRLLACGLLLGGAMQSWGDWGGVRSENLVHVEMARLSNASFRGREYDRALIYAEAAEASKPGAPQAPSLRAQALVGLGRTEEAIIAFREAVRRVPEDSVSWFNLGMLALEGGGDDAEALACLDRALSLRPAYVRARAWSVLASARLGKGGEARALAEPLVKLLGSSPSPEVLAAVAASRCASGDGAAAQSIARQVRANAPEADAAEFARLMRLARADACLGT